jgi:uncharacterized protein (DUF2062 family)
MTTGAAALRRRLSAVLHLDDPPWRIALALAVGVFIGCTPLIGVQTILAILVATVMRLNKAATVTGAWLNLPWFAPFVYAAALEVGTRFVPAAAGPRQAAVAILTAPLHAVSIDDLAHLLSELSIALVVGTTLVGLAAAGVTYVLALWLVTRRRRRHLPPASDHRQAA